MVNQFEEIWEQQYIWDSDMMSAHVADNMEDFINQFRELFSREDMKKLFMQEMMKQITVKWKFKIQHSIETCTLGCSDGKPTTDMGEGKNIIFF